MKSDMAQGKLRAYIEIASLIAIVVSIALLGFEIRQNTVAVRATALQQHFTQHTSLMLERMDNPALREAVGLARRGIDALENDPAKTALYFPYAANVMRDHFIAYELMRSGLLPERQWRTYYAALSRYLTGSRGNRELWKQRRDEYPADYQSIVDEIVRTAESE
jgi:hypothetical protein